MNSSVPGEVYTVGASSSGQLCAGKVVRVEVLDEEAQLARVTVPDYQLSLAIGKEGQNARLAARLTGWKIDIHSDADKVE